MDDPKKHISLLRQITTQEFILDGKKRVNLLKASDIITTYQSLSIDQSTLPQIIEPLIQARILVKANIQNKKSKKCTINLSTKFDPSASYIFVHDSTNWLHIILAFVCIIVILSVFMNQLWPKRLKHYSSYVFYPIIAFLCFIVVLGFVRLIFFAVTFFAKPPGIWLFPNLFADVGFFESFVPVWCYHGEDCRKSKEE